MGDENLHDLPPRIRRDGSRRGCDHQEMMGLPAEPSPLPVVAEPKGHGTSGLLRSSVETIPLRLRGLMLGTAGVAELADAGDLKSPASHEA